MSLSFYLMSETGGEPVEAFWKNITHNLGKMAQACGCYEALWRPEEHGFEYAYEIKPVLEVSLIKLQANPNEYDKFDSPNGWGKREHLVEFLFETITACKKYPNAKIEASI